MAWCMVAKGSDDLMFMPCVLLGGMRGSRQCSYRHQIGTGRKNTVGVLETCERAACFVELERTLTPNGTNRGSRNRRVKGGWERMENNSQSL